MPIPARIASAGLDSVIGEPSTSMVPSSGRCTPYRIFISVDLPAPFSPTSACTVPRRTVMLTSWLATTPGKRLVIPLSRTAGAAVWTSGAVLTELLVTAAGARRAGEAGRGAGRSGATLPRHPGPASRPLGRDLPVSGHIVLGTVILPSMI